MTHSEPMPPFPARVIDMKPAIIGIEGHVYATFPSPAARRWFEEWLKQPATWDAYILWAHEEAPK
jgi:hypothetical protein